MNRPAAPLLSALVPHLLRLRLLRAGLLGSGLLLASTGLAQPPTPAGTVITNQAAATFEPPTPGEAASALSGVVRTTVQAVCAVSVLPDGTVEAPGQSVSVLPGETASFSYTAVNAGNAPFTLAVAGRVEGRGGFTPGLRVVLDRDEDGAADADEPEVAEVTLGAGGRARLLLLAAAGAQARGDAWVNLVVGCAGGEVDANNVSRLRALPPPLLSVDKSFSPARLRPGDETTVTVTAHNGGLSESREVLLTDALAAQAAQGLLYVPGSAQASAGLLEFSADGLSWQAAEAAQVRGVRVRADRLAPGAGLTLSFRMRATAEAENQSIPNVATVTTPGQRAHAQAIADVRYRPAVALGPPGLPEAPENTPADTQSRAFAVAGQPVCFDHTLKNTGDVRDLFTLTVGYPVGGGQATLLGGDGAPLAQPLPLDPGQAVPVRVCHGAAQAGSFEALITVEGARGTANTTRDRVQTVEAGLPELVKSVTPAPDQTVARGQTLTYTLSVRNPYTRPLTGLSVRDPLPAHTAFVAASDGGALSTQGGAQVVTWTLDTLAPGASRSFTVTVRVGERAPDGEALRNVFQLVAAELPIPLPSNEVVSPVWSAALEVSKAVSSARAAPGDRLSYTLHVRNLSATTAIERAVVSDTPARGLSYLPGSATLNGQPLADPLRVDGVLRWQLGTLPAGSVAVLTYALRVTPEAAGSLLNRVEVQGVGAGGAGRAIASNVATAVTRLSLLPFAPLGDILGTVFVDRNRNGLYDAGLDTPLERARVLLAGGRLALTDAQGRYHFAQVPSGPHALRLDPHSAPYAPLNAPQDGGLSGTRTVQVRGLTGVDFALAPVGGEVSATRRTTLIAGEVRVEKTVLLTPQGYAVTLRLSTPAALPGFELDDPLPPGARLQGGRQTWSGTLEAGETTLAYRFEFSGDPAAAVTDPAIRWRN